MTSFPSSLTLRTSPVPNSYKYSTAENSITSQIKQICNHFKDTDISDNKTSNPERDFEIRIGSSGEVYAISKSFFRIYDWLPPWGDFEPFNLYLKIVKSLDNSENVIPVQYNRKLNKPIVALFEKTEGKLYDCHTFHTYSFISDKYNDVSDTRVTESENHFAIINKTTNTTVIYNLERELVKIDTTVFDIKGDLIIYKTKYTNTTATLSISSNKNLANKLLNAMVDIVKDLKESNNDYKRILVDAYNTITKQTEYVECRDLKTLKLLFRVGLPQGVSNLALSSNNLEFVSVSSRGDEILKWDFSQLQSAKRVILTDRHTRGQSTATLNSLQLIDDHVLCVNSNTGSVHYLGNNGWKLPKFGAKAARAVKTYFLKTFIVILDANENILIANTNGKIITYIDMSQIGSMEGAPDSASFEIAKAKPTALTWKYQHMEIDVDTCGPYPFAFRNRHFTFTKLPDEESITPALLNSLSL